MIMLNDWLKNRYLVYGFVAVLFIAVYYFLKKKRQQSATADKPAKNPPPRRGGTSINVPVLGKISLPSVVEFPKTPSQADDFVHKHRDSTRVYTIEELKKMAIERQIAEGKRNAEGKLIDENGIEII
ncbi:MAG: hypothetical protein Q4A56_07690 [Porphyromonadaceae bacterium]|nr:hypothetical protein [Porphyromonadaceae bacterium]